MKSGTFASATVAALLLVGALACTERHPTALLRAPDFALVPSDLAPTGEHVVVFSGSAPDGFAERVAELGGTIQDIWPEIGVAVTLGLTDSAAAELERMDGIAGIDRDVELQWIPAAEQLWSDDAASPSGAVIGGAYLFPEWQWNLRQIEADQAWVGPHRGQGTRVAILDTGIDSTHVDLVGKIDLAASRSCHRDAGIRDRNAHGTFVAGIVTSNRRYIESVAPDAQLIAIKVLGPLGVGSFATIICGVMHATSVGADVVNMSLGGVFHKNDPGIGDLLTAWNRATNYATSQGVLIVAAAGNGAEDLDHDGNLVVLPAQSANVLSVAATGPIAQMFFDSLALYSNYGASAVNVVAPGGQSPLVTGNLHDGIVSVCSSFSSIPGLSCRDQRDRYLAGGRGTSFAAPHVSGLAAALKSANPALSPQQLRQCIQNGADDIGKKGVDNLYSHGRINVPATLAC